MQKHIFYDIWCATDKVRNINIEYDRSKKIKDQILYEEGHVKLLNVSKSYCDGDYQGVWFLFLVDTDFIKNFKPKDRGFTESVVDNFDSLISLLKKLTIFKDINESINFTKTVGTETFDFVHSGKIVNCEKVYINEKYAFSNYSCEGIVQRGAYSKFPIFSSTNSGNDYYLDDDKTIIDYYKNKSAPSLANTVTLTSTNYSTITYDNSF